MSSADPSQYRDEVIRRWGEPAYADSQRWWQGLGAAGRDEFAADGAALNDAWQQLAASGLPADGPAAQELADRHLRWVQRAWGGRRPTPAELTGLAAMYVDDERFAVNYGGAAGATYVRAALTAYAQGMEDTAGQ